MILTRCDKCIKMIRGNHWLQPSSVLFTLRGVLSQFAVIRWSLQIKSDNTVVASVSITVPHQLSFFFLFWPCVAAVVCLWSIIYYIIVYYFLWCIFCIRHIMDGCIIFFMLIHKLRSILVKYLNKHARGWALSYLIYYQESYHKESWPCYHSSVILTWHACLIMH